MQKRLLINCLLVGLAASSFLTPRLEAQVDNFSDGDDVGWINYDPFFMAGLGSRVTFDPSGGTYRLTSLASPNPLAIGPARGASFRDVVYADFCVSVDVPVYDAGLEQAFGILARVAANPAPGAVFGYAMTYHPIDNDIQITRLDNEQVTEISDWVVLSEPPASGVLRLVFFGVGDRLVGRAYDAGNPVFPLAETVITDATHASGVCGLVIFDNTDLADQTADATFDNYRAGSGMPEELRIEKGAVAGEVKLCWEFPFFAHDLEQSVDMDIWDWSTFLAEVPVYTNGTFCHTATVTEGGPRNFFRLSREPLP